ncbi:MAG: DNA primase noncatalytic subunit PriX [Nitrososphaerales archaeon]
MTGYYQRPEVLEALACQCRSREVFLKGVGYVSSRPLKAEGLSELAALLKQHMFAEPYGVFASIERFENPLEYASRIGWDFCIDFDADSLDQAKKCLLSTVGVLQVFGVSTYRVKYSGRRGFHLIIDGEAFNLFTQEGFVRSYPQLPNYICEFIEASLKPSQKLGVKFDYSLYQPRRLLRLAYSLHEESGLVSQPLTVDQISSFKPEDASPDKVKVNFDWINLKPQTGEAWSLLEAVLKWLKDKRVEEDPALRITGPKAFKITRRYRWVEKLLQKPVDDGRHRILWLIIAPYLVNVKGLNAEEAENTALEYLHRCSLVKEVSGDLRRLVKYYVKYAEAKRLKPISLRKLEENHKELHQILKHEGVV